MLIFFEIRLETKSLIQAGGGGGLYKFSAKNLPSTCLCVNDYKSYTNGSSTATARLVKNVCADEVF